MALCRYETKIISRSGGRSTVGAASYRTGRCATSAAAYRAAATLTDERTGTVHDFTRKRGVLAAEIMLPEGAPAWMGDREQLWNAVERAEKRVDAQLARDHVLTLPHELSVGQRRELTRDFVRAQFVDKGYVADIAWHMPHGKGDERNFHAHVMVVMRRVDGDGFARTKERPPDGQHPAEHWKAELRAKREAWANAGADALQAAGFTLEAERFRAGHMTIEKQREAAIARGDHGWAETLDREAEPKQGPIATKMEREGRPSFAGADRQRIKAENAERAALAEEQARLTAEIMNLEKERIRRGKGGMFDISEKAHEDRHGRERGLLTQAAEDLSKVKQAEAARIAEIEEAKKREAANQAATDKQHAQGDIASAPTRYSIAVARFGNSADPYTSLGQAAAHELALFRQEQKALQAQIANEPDRAKREMLETRRQIEAHDYSATVRDRCEQLVYAVTRNSAHPEAANDREAARKHREAAASLREQYATQKREQWEKQERGEGAKGIEKRGEDSDQGRRGLRDRAPREMSDRKRAAIRSAAAFRQSERAAGADQEEGMAQAGQGMGC